MTRLETSDLLGPIRVGLRSKLVVCMLVILSGYFYHYGGDPIVRLVSISVMFISAEMMTYFWCNFVGKNLIEMWLEKKSAISWIDTPDFMTLANKMRVKLNRKQPFGLRKGYDNAYAKPKGQVVFGEVLLERLDSEERLSLAAHELTHLKHNHPMKIMIPLLVAIPIYLTFPLNPEIIRLMACVAAFIIGFIFVSWHNEYDADAGAAANTSAKATISLLRKIVAPDKRTCESESHPSINNRISKLLAGKDKRKT